MRTFPMPGGGTATLSTSRDAQGLVVAQLSYTDSDKNEQHILLDKSSVLRFGEDGSVEVTPCGKGEATEETLAGVKNLSGKQLSQTKNVHTVQGTEGDDLVILLPSGEKNSASGRKAPESFQNMDRAFMTQPIRRSAC